MPTPLSILVVEDDEGLRYAFTTALERSGFAVDSASHGGDALRFLNERGDEYEAVLLDLLLPTVHGSSIIAHIAQTRPKLAVVAVTGYPDRVLFADPADRHVVKAIFVKPVDPVDIAAYLMSRSRRRNDPERNNP